MTSSRETSSSKNNSKSVMVYTNTARYISMPQLVGRRHDDTTTDDATYSVIHQKRESDCDLHSTFIEHILTPMQKYELHRA